MRTREEIEKDIDALFVGGCQDRIMTVSEFRNRLIMLGKYREELDELDMLEESKQTSSAVVKKSNVEVKRG